MYIAIDIGGTKIEIASLRDLSPDSLVNQKKIATSQNYNEGFEEILNTIKKVSEDEKIEGIGVALAAQFDEEGKISFATNIPDWDQKPLLPMLKEEFECEVIGDNDAITGGLAEFHFGNIDVNKMLFLIMGTGFGGSYIQNTKNGLFKLAMEPGGMILDPEGWKHYHQKTQGIAGAYLGGKSIEKNTNKSLPEVSDSDELWDEVLQKMAIAINNMTVCLRPEAVVIGGGLIAKRPFLIDKVNTRLQNYQEYITQPKVLLSSIEGNSSLLGALALLK